MYVLACVLFQVCACDAESLHSLRCVYLQEAAAADRNVVLTAGICTATTAAAAAAARVRQ
jgi:hypothetical protein